METTEYTKAMNFKEAYDRSKRICQYLEQLCDLIHIAGSVRRCQAQIQSLKIVVLPKEEDAPQKSIFSEYQETVRPESFKKAISNLGTIEIGDADSKYLRVRLYDGVLLDIYMPDLNDYWRIYAICVGPDYYVKRIIIDAWQKKGWVDTAHGLRRLKDCRKNSSGKWECVNYAGEVPPSWSSELEFYEWLGIQFREHELR